MSKNSINTQSEPRLRKRPIYVVAHMVNGESQVNADWVKPANAIESDLAFNSDGSPQRFYHGPIPCDCLRNCIKADNVVSHLALVREKALHQNLTLFWMDLKLGDSGISDFKKSGEKIAKMMTQSGSLFPPGESIPLHVLLGAEDIEQKEFFVGFRKYIKINRPELLDQFGYDFSGTDTDIDEILRTFKDIGIRKNIWIGDGTINCWFRGTHRSKQIIARRDQLDTEFDFKVYSWTIDNESSLKKHLRLGVDAIITNRPAKLRDIIQEDFHDSLSIASQKDNPWEQLQLSEVTTPLIQSCDNWFLGYSYCWKQIGPNSNDWCWTDKECSQPNNCFGELECSTLKSKRT